MIQTRHCDLCEFPKRNLESGLTCGLTDNKPNFKVSCSEIKFSNSFKEYLSELLREIEQVKKRKTIVYLEFTLFGAIGLIIIFGSRSRLVRTFEMEFNYSSYLYLVSTLLIFGIGTFFISRAFRSLIKYRKTLKKLESDKTEIDMVLNNYNIDIAMLLNR